MEKNKTTGGVTHIKIDTTVPAMNLDGDYNKLNILVGTNGVGKSFILKCTWVLSYISAAIIVSKLDNKSLLELVKFTFKYSFYNCDINGIISYDFESGSNVTVKLEQGIPVDVNYSGFEEVNQATKPVYMSADMRLFNDIHKLISLKSTIEKYSGLKNEDLILELLKTYRLYDFVYVEDLINKCPISLDEEFNKRLETYDLNLICTKIIKKYTNDFIIKYGICQWEEFDDEYLCNKINKHWGKIFLCLISIDKLSTVTSIFKDMQLGILPHEVQNVEYPSICPTDPRYRHIRSYFTNCHIYGRRDW